MLRDTDVTVRRALEADADGIGFVHYTAWLETYTGLLPPEYLAARSARKSADMFRSTGCADLVVAQAGERIVGFCGWGRLRDPSDECTGEIQGIYLLDEYKKKGLGRRLLD